ncbi:sensor histidine kinase [Prauserella muralis]|uniref:sensor histidine kinase n=1 Tax=Prauserella muralis TaxID=588067 RepID=UPI003CCC4BB4
MVREGLSNAVRHPRAHGVTLDVRAAAELVVEIADDGVGLPEGARQSGLANLRERARACGGDLAVGPGPRGGTRLLWTVPLPG